MLAWILNLDFAAGVIYEIPEGLFGIISTTVAFDILSTSSEWGISGIGIKWDIGSTSAGWNVIGSNEY